MHWPTKLRKLSHTSRERGKEREGEGEREEAKRQSSYSRTISQFCLLSVSAIFLLLSLSSPQRDTNLFSSLPSFYFCFFFYSVLSHWLFTLMKFTCLIFMPCLVPSPICHLSYTIDYIRYTHDESVSVYLSVPSISSNQKLSASSAILAVLWPC